MAQQSDLLSQVVEAAAEGVAISGHQKEAARRTEALSMRLAGLPTSQIAERMGISETAVDDMIQRSLDRAERQGVAQLRAIENARLDRAQAGIWAKVIQGDLKSISVFLQISAARAKMNGLYAPTQVQMSMTIRQEMEDALSGLERLVLEAPTMVLEERRDVTEPGSQSAA